MLKIQHYFCHFKAIHQRLFIPLASVVELNWKFQNMLTVFSFYGQFLLSQDKPRHQNHQMQQACLSHESVYSFGTVEIYLLDVAFIFFRF